MPSQPIPIPMPPPVPATWLAENSGAPLAFVAHDSRPPVVAAEPGVWRRRRARRRASSRPASILGWFEWSIDVVTDPRWWSWLGTPDAWRRPSNARPGASAQPAEPKSVAHGLWLQFRRWLAENGRFHVLSTLLHAVVIVVLGLIAGNFQRLRSEYGPVFDTTLGNASAASLKVYKLGDAPLEPSVLDTKALTEIEPLPIGQLEQHNDESPIFEPRGGGVATPEPSTLAGLGGFEVAAVGNGQLVAGPGGVGMGAGSGKQPGAGSDDLGFGGRGAGQREAMVGAFGGTRQTERAVVAALNWLARHQNTDGSWSLDQFERRCSDRTCTCPAAVKSDSAATALALLPFLASGQTQLSRGPHQRTIRNGLYWLVNLQMADGCLAGQGNYSLMYSHALATIAVSEAYALTHDSRLGAVVRSAVRYTERAQDPSNGGWRYVPGQPGDSSVTGWQVMALKSAQLAGVEVNSDTLRAAQRFWKSVAHGSAGSEFSYLPGEEPSRSMTAVGLLCAQYQDATRNDAQMTRGLAYLTQNSATREARDIYYWYYATQVMHNLPGRDWDNWNRQVRRLLVESQVREGCATGSWNPEKPTRDAWGEHGGRLMQTSLSALTLEVYYRYLPLFRLDKPGSPLPPAGEPQPIAGK